jgi:hypothetical protein
MTYEEYTRERERLKDVLKDACNRGDYHLEMDVSESLRELDIAYYEEEEK